MTAGRARPIALDHATRFEAYHQSPSYGDSILDAAYCAPRDTHVTPTELCAVLHIASALVVPDFQATSAAQTVSSSSIATWETKRSWATAMLGKLVQRQGFWLERSRLRKRICCLHSR
jgi:hypothetical protein